MKTTIKTLAIAACMLIGLTAVAQRHENRATQMAKRQTERLTQKLSLSDEQSKKVEAILVDFNKQCFAEMKADSTQKAPNPALVEKRNGDLKQVFTPEQYETFSKMEMAKSNFGPRQHRGEFRRERQRDNSAE